MAVKTFQASLLAVQMEAGCPVVVVGKELDRRGLLTMHDLLTRLLAARHSEIVIDFSHTAHVHYLTGDVVKSKADRCRRIGGFLQVRGANPWISSLLAFGGTVIQEQPLVAARS